MKDSVLSIHQKLTVYFSIFFVFSVFCGSVSFAQDGTQPSPAPSTTEKDEKKDVPKEEPITVYMPDGQLKSHLIRVYVTKNIISTQNPRLNLLYNYAFAASRTKAEYQADNFEPLIVAPNQEWIEIVSGEQAPHSGTLMLFDISKIKMSCKAMVRVTPIVSWNEGKIEIFAVGKREVNIGNSIIDTFWTIVVVMSILLLLIKMSNKKPLYFITAPDGHLSLAKTQIACWTVIVGSVVLGYGLIRLEIPSIPESLLVLMGSSLVTGGIASFRDDDKVKNKKQATPTLRDLVSVQSNNKHLSLAKAQMIFWTLLLLVLFVIKSMLDGAIWEIPWELVALMGFSQAGYLAPKLAPQPTTTTAQPTEKKLGDEL